MAWHHDGCWDEHGSCATCGLGKSLSSGPPESSQANPRVQSEARSNAKAAKIALVGALGYALAALFASSALFDLSGGFALASAGGGLLLGALVTGIWSYIFLDANEHKETSTAAAGLVSLIAGLLISGGFAFGMSGSLLTAACFALCAGPALGLGLLVALAVLGAT